MNKKLILWNLKTNGKMPFYKIWSIYDKNRNLNVESPEIMTRVTEYIPEIV